MFAREEEEEELALSSIKNKHINHRLFSEKTFFLLNALFMWVFHSDDDSLENFSSSVAWGFYMYKNFNGFNPNSVKMFSCWNAAGCALFSSEYIVCVCGIKSCKLEFFPHTQRSLSFLALLLQFWIAKEGGKNSFCDVGRRWKSYNIPNPNEDASLGKFMNFRIKSVKSSIERYFFCWNFKIKFMLRCRIERFSTLSSTQFEFSCLIRNFLSFLLLAEAKREKFAINLSKNVKKTTRSKWEFLSARGE